MPKTTALMRLKLSQVCLVHTLRRSMFLVLTVALPYIATSGLVANGVRAQQHDATPPPTANAVLIRNAYDAFSRGDIDAVMAIFARDIVWHVPGRGPLSRDYRGHEEVLGFFGHFMSLSKGTFRLRVDDVLASGDRVVVLCTETAQRGDRSWTAPQVHVWTVKDGKATMFREYEGDEQGDDEFWSSPG